MPCSDPEKLVRDSLAKGTSPEQIAAVLRSAGVNPIPAVKALHRAAGIPIWEGKFLVDTSLPPEWRAATERLRDAADQVILGEDGSETPEEEL